MELLKLNKMKKTKKSSAKKVVVKKKAAPKVKKAQVGVKKKGGPSKATTYKMYIDDGKYVQKYKFKEGDKPLYTSPDGKTVEGGPTKVSKIRRTLKGFLTGAPRVKKNPMLEFYK